MASPSAMAARGTVGLEVVAAVALRSLAQPPNEDDRETLEWSPDLR